MHKSKRRNLNFISLLWFGSLFGALLGFMTQVIMARQLGPILYGVLSSVIAFATILVPFIGFGIPGFWLKIFGKEKIMALRWVVKSIHVFLISSLFFSVVFVFFIYLKDYKIENSYFLYFMFLYMIGQSTIELVSSKIQIDSRFVLLSIWQFMPHFLRFVFLLIFYEYFSCQNYIEYSIYSYVLSSVFVIFFGFIILSKFYKIGKNYVVDGKELTLNDVWSESWSFGVSSVFYIVFFQGITIISSVIGSIDSAGFFNILFVILQAVYILPTVIYNKLLMPKIHNIYYEDISELYLMYKKGTFYMFIIGMVSMSFLILFGPFLVPFIFGDDYSDLVFPLVLISLSIPMRFVAIVSGAILMTDNNSRIKVKYMAYSTIIGLIFSVFLIPRYGVIGAAISVVVNDFLIMIFYKNIVKIKVFKVLV